MPVDTKHPQYKQAEDDWRRCRDVLDGERAVKAAGILYLPALEGQSARDYESYKTRAMFFAASSRTRQGLAGAIFRKEPELTVPAAMEDLLDHLGNAGQSLEQLTHTTLDEVIGMGRVGLLVDAPDDVENGEPFLSIYYAEDIVSWNSQLIAGRQVLTRVVLREMTQTPDPKDPFAFKPVTKYRVLRLGQASGTDGAEVEPTVASDALTYFVEVWAKVEATSSEKESWFIEKTTVPRMRGGKALDEIPFIFIGPSSQEPEVEKSPTLDLANVNLAHYRNSADLEHGLHMSALPTAWAAGFDLKGDELKVGSVIAWVTNEPAAHCGFLEFTGAGLGAIKEAMQEKKSEMAALGARLLEEQKREAEAAETLRLRQSGEQSVLAKIAGSCSEGIEHALELVAQWLALGGEIAFKLNRDFNLLGIEPAMVTQLMLAVQSGMLSWNTWFYNIQRGELIPDNVTAEDEAALIAAGPPMGVLPTSQNQKNEQPAQDEAQDEEPDEDAKDDAEPEDDGKEAAA